MIVYDYYSVLICKGSIITGTLRIEKRAMTEMK